MKKQTFQRQMDLLERYHPGPGRVLDVGCASGAFLAAATERGWAGEGIERSRVAAEHAQRATGVPVHAGTLDEFAGADGSFDAVHMADVIEHLLDPRAALRRVRRLLTAHGILVLTTCDIDSVSARLLRTRWPNYKREHLFYPDRRTMRAMLEQEGLGVLSMTPAVKSLTWAFAAAYTGVYGPRLAAMGMRAVAPLVPRWLQRYAWRVSAGDMLVIASPAA
jgi:SAM-dependent methyltransferase